MKISFVHNLKTKDGVEEAEFDTPETIRAISQALAQGGHQITELAMTMDESWIAQLRRQKPDLVFNTAEGFRGIGRESFGPIVFEQLGLPYVGPGPYVCFLTLDKFLTKQMVAQRGVPVVEGFFVTRRTELEAVAKDIVFPAFVKPNYEGSSKGITQRSICHDLESLLSYGRESLELFPEGLLIERFIPGKDVSIGYISGLGDGGILETVEYEVLGTPGSEWIYDFDHKNQFDEKVKAVCPAFLSEPTLQLIREYMKRCVEVLGIVDLGRADFRVTPDGDVFFMEFNALPSLQPGAGIFEATQRIGLDYSQTLQQILQAALGRMKLVGRSRASRSTVIRRPKVGLVYNLRRKQITEEGFEEEAEFDSPKTIATILETLRQLNVEPIAIEATKDLSENLKENQVNVVFNIAEGISSRARESQVPAVCDLLGVEHTGSDATSLSIALDKTISKKLVSAAGVLTPRSVLFSHVPKKLPKLNLNFPVIVKPNQEGTSKGISDNSVVHNEVELYREMTQLWQKLPGPILCEEFIQGREFTVGVFGNLSLKVLGPLEIKFKKPDFAVYSLRAKMDDNPEDNEFLSLVCPVKDLDPKAEKQMAVLAKRVFRALGCRDVARIDLRMDSRQNIYFLEANPLPGLTPGFSDLAIMAERLGWTYPQLIKSIVEPAIQRWRASTKSKAFAPR